MKPSEALERLGTREAIREIIARSGCLSNPRIFGSVLRGDDREGSDLDILVDEIGDDPSLLDRLALIPDLEAIVGVKVDLRTPDELPARCRVEIVAKAQPLDAESWDYKDAPSVTRRERLCDYLQRMREAIDNAESVTSGKAYADFLEDECLRGAVLHHMTVLGSMAERIMTRFPEWASRHRAVDWGEWRDFGNSLIEQYFAVDYARVWEAVRRLPALRDGLTSLAHALDSNDPDGVAGLETSSV